MCVTAKDYLTKLGDGDLEQGKKVMAQILLSSPHISMSNSCLA